MVGRRYDRGKVRDVVKKTKGKKSDRKGEGGVVKEPVGKIGKGKTSAVV